MGLADAIYNFKWVKIIQIWQNGGKIVFKSCWLMSRFIICLTRNTNYLMRKKKKKIKYIRD